jgi:hypothetical protein
MDTTDERYEYWNPGDHKPADLLAAKIEYYDEISGWQPSCAPIKNWCNYRRRWLKREHCNDKDVIILGLKRELLTFMERDLPRCELYRYKGKCENCDDGCADYRRVLELRSELK